MPLPGWMIVAAALAAAADALPELTVVVFDTDGMPLPGAAVCYAEHPEGTKLTDDQGVARLPWPQPDATLMAERPPLHPARLEIAVTGPATQPVILYPGPLEIPPCELWLSRRERRRLHRRWRREKEAPPPPPPRVCLPPPAE